MSIIRDSLDLCYKYMQPQGVGVLSQNNVLASNNQVIKIKFHVKNYCMIGLYYIHTFSVLYDL